VRSGARICGSNLTGDRKFRVWVRSPCLWGLESAFGCELPPAALGGAGKIAGQKADGRWAGCALMSCRALGRACGCAGGRPPDRAGRTGAAGRRNRSRANTDSGACRDTRPGRMDESQRPSERMELGKPCSGKPLARFDEGGRRRKRTKLCFPRRRLSPSLLGDNSSHFVWTR